MELKLLTTEQIRTVYARDLIPSFPDAERKPLPAIEKLCAMGQYEPWGLLDGGEIVGEAFLWLGAPGWALVDYLCVTAARRNDGLGAVLIEMLLEEKRGSVVFGETETPAYAPDPDMARRRQGFYRRCGAQFAAFQSEVFGVVYDLIYWSDAPVAEDSLMARYDEIYRRAFRPALYDRYVRIPRDQAAAPQPQVPWDE